MGALKRWTLAGCLLILVVQAGCKTAPAENELLATDTSSFVKVDPSNPMQLMYKSRNFRFSSTNSYNIISSKDSADKQFAMMQEMGTNALRMWGFSNGKADSLQPSLGYYNENKWRDFDYVVATAGQKNIKLIIVLSNYWGDYGGIEFTNKWLGIQGNEREDFFTDPRARAQFSDYVLHILNRRNTITGVLYKDDPTIMMWEPINEIRMRTEPSGQGAVEWLTWASMLIKANAPNQLVSDGGEGFFMKHHAHYKYPWKALGPLPFFLRDGRVIRNFSEGAYFESICRIPSIDVCSIHAWPGNWYMEWEDKPDEFVSEWIEEHLSYMQNDPYMKKPLFVGEFGWQVIRNRGAAAQEERRKVFERAYFVREKNQRKVRENVAGIGFWNITGGGVDENILSFDVKCPTDKDVCALIKEFSKMQIR